MKKNLSLGLILGCITIYSSVVFAETIYLKSGSKLSGKIVNQSAKLVMIQDGNGKYLSYHPNEIKDIKKDKNDLVGLLIPVAIGLLPLCIVVVGIKRGAITCKGGPISKIDHPIGFWVLVWFYSLLSAMVFAVILSGVIKQYY